MDFKVLISDNAIADLQRIVQFIAQDDSQAALRLGERLITEALQLAAFPMRHAFHDRRRGIRKMPLSPYLVFYSCDEANRIVNVLHFWHGA